MASEWGACRAAPEEEVAARPRRRPRDLRAGKAPRVVRAQRGSPQPAGGPWHLAPELFPGPTRKEPGPAREDKP